MRNVLFLCIGNSCRSQMAEGFAKCYGKDVVAPLSAGLAPAPVVQELTRDVMARKNIHIDDQYPKELSEMDLGSIDLLINMSGMRIPLLRSSLEVRQWDVEDPIGKNEAVYLKVRDQIEDLVMRLILELRKAKKNIPRDAARPRLVRF